MSYFALRSANLAASEHGTKWRILLVDDDPAQRIAIGCMLERGGYEVITAEDGQEALLRLKRERISLLLTDWEMPGIDGVELCRVIREATDEYYTYIVIQTSHKDLEHVVTGLQAGADDFLSKPIAEAELLARLNTGKRLLEMEQALRRANEDNLRLCVIDPLTGIYNRRYLSDQLKLELARAMRYNHPLSVVLCDVDHFKSINDTYGHHGGDAALTQCTQVLRNCLRDSDWIARYGGEEFVIVLPETTADSATVVAERCRHALENTPVKLTTRSISMTASFGISAWQPSLPDNADPDLLLASADAGLYTSKNNGRNRVTCQSSSHHVL